MNKKNEEESDKEAQIQKRDDVELRTVNTCLTVEGGEARVKQMIVEYFPELMKYVNSQTEGSQVLNEINKNR